MKAKKVAAVALTAAMTVSMAASVNVFAADGYDPADFKSDKDSSEWTIAVVTKDNTANWFKRMEVGVNEFGEETGINVIQKGPANADAASQVQVIDDMINQGVDALCVVPIDPGAIEASLKNAMDKGIVVVTHEASNQHLQQMISVQLLWMRLQLTWAKKENMLKWLLTQQVLHIWNMQMQRKNVRKKLIRTWN